VNLWLVIFAAGVVTFLIRLSFIAAHGRIEAPRWFTRSLTFVPVAVLSAIIFPELLTREGEFILSLGNARLGAGVVAALIAWRTQNVWLTIAGGMLTLFLLQRLVA
jgi:branched-subunit amino acid transport protein